MAELDTHTFWACFYTICGLLAALTLVSIPIARAELSDWRADRAAKRTRIDWSPDHNLVLVGPDGDPRNEYSFDEVVDELIDAKQALLHTRRQANFLHRMAKELSDELEHQIELKRRYWRKLHQQ